MDASIVFSDPSILLRTVGIVIPEANTRLYRAEEVEDKVVFSLGPDTAKDAPSGDAFLLRLHPLGKGKPMLRNLAKKALKRAAGKILGRGGPAPSDVVPASSPTVVVPTSPLTPPVASGPGDGIRFAPLDEIHEAVLGPGKLRLVNHWATWCAGCLEELHLLVELHGALGNEVEFLGISWESFEGGMLGQDLIDEVRSHSRRHGLSWGSLLVEAPPPEFFDRLGMTCHTVPQVWLINEAGTVVHRIERILEPEDIQNLHTLVEELLEAS